MAVRGASGTLPADENKRRERQLGVSLRRITAYNIRNTKEGTGERTVRVLAAENISKRYGERALLSDVTLQINQGDKIGLVGINGTGKSTLLRLLAGEEAPDAGSVFRQPGQRVAYLPQNPAFAPEDTVLEHVLRYAGRDVQRESYRAKTILTKLGVTDFGEKVGRLSGGQKKRLAMAAALVQPSEILILDEPTNHLDYEMAEWLEGQLKSYKGSLVMVTHDRYFLDRVCSCIVEIDRGRLYRYQANYEGFLQLKSEREESARASERKRQSLLKRELAWLQRGARARGTKSRERIQRVEALQNQSGPAREETLAMESLETRLGRKTLEAKAVSKAYGAKTLIEDFSYIVLPRDRIGIVGKNGSGKSTLVKLLCGLVPPDSGEVVRGETVKIGYFSQESEELDPQKRVIDIVRGIAEDVHTKQGVITASQMLERFLFPGELQYRRVESLSGGERRRLLLLCVLMGSPNLLFLDEPTNDLDIQTLQVLEEYLENFAGAVIAVSHDRYFLDRVTEKGFALMGDGRVQPFLGGYAAYLEAQRQRQAEVRSQSGRPAERAAPREKSKTKFSYHEQREYDTIEEEIETLEQALGGIKAQMAQAGSDYVALQRLTEEQQALETKIEQRMDRWAELEEMARRMRS